MATTSTTNAVQQIIDQVPSADQYGLNLLKDKVEFLKELTPPVITVDAESVGMTSDSPVFDSLNN